MQRDNGVQLIHDAVQLVGCPDAVRRLRDTGQIDWVFVFERPQRRPNGLITSAVVFCTKRHLQPDVVGVSGQARQAYRFSLHLCRVVGVLGGEPRSPRHVADCLILRSHCDACICAVALIVEEDKPLRPCERNPQLIHLTVGPTGLEGVGQGDVEVFLRGVVRVQRQRVHSPSEVVLGLDILKVADGRVADPHVRHADRTVPPTNDEA